MAVPKQAVELRLVALLKDTLSNPNFLSDFSCGRMTLLTWNILLFLMNSLIFYSILMKPHS